MKRLGVGRCAEIFELSGDHVLKLYEADFDAETVAHFAQMGTAVHGAGVRAPEVLALESRGARHGIVLERINGPTLWDAVADAPERAEQFGAQLADLHIAVHNHSIDGLASKLEELERRVEARRAHDRSVDAALEVVARGHTLPQVLLHGDLHPANVMVDESTGALVSIDWDGAMYGPACIDVARTEYLVSSWALAPGTTERVEPVRRAVADGFVERYDEVADQLVGSRSEWRLPVVLARYAENVVEEIGLLGEQVASLS